MHVRIYSGRIAQARNQSRRAADRARLTRDTLCLLTVAVIPIAAFVLYLRIRFGN